VEQVTGTVCPLDRADVDTDQIIPKQFLKRIDRTGFGPFAFNDWRYDEHGLPRDDFPMNRPEYEGASILLTGPNFGCGSSREHAPWALQDAGFEAIIAPSFADIFRSNCGKIGLLAVELPGDDVRRLFDLVAADPSVEITVDLRSQTVSAAGFEASFDIDAHTKHCLIEGLDEIGLTLQHDDAVAAFEGGRPGWLPTAS
jgi:3-isopropylmalate/(R)-2-methylmalate dehydratase small subunit